MKKNKVSKENCCPIDLGELCKRAQAYGCRMEEEKNTKGKEKSND